MNLNVLTDSCFWIGLFSPEDQHHDSSVIIADMLEPHRIVIPWPCLYETVTTRLMRRPDRAALFEEFLKKPNVILLDDSEYKSKALEDVFEQTRRVQKTYSLTDGVIRGILSDYDYKIDWFVSFNADDFADVCFTRGIQMLKE